MRSGKAKRVVFLMRGSQRFVEEDLFLSADFDSKVRKMIPLVGFTLLRFISGGSRT